MDVKKSYYLVAIGTFSLWLVLAFYLYTALKFGW